jgi:hypothetical protein
MSANANWARWIFASVADHLKYVATATDLPVLVEHLDERTPQFSKATDRAEIRITGPFSQEISAWIPPHSARCQCLAHKPL